MSKRFRMIRLQSDQDAKTVNNIWHRIRPLQKVSPHREHWPGGCNTAVPRSAPVRRRLLLRRSNFQALWADLLRLRISGMDHSLYKDEDPIKDYLLSWEVLLWKYRESFCFTDITDNLLFSLASF